MKKLPVSQNLDKILASLPVSSDINAVTEWLLTLDTAELPKLANWQAQIIQNYEIDDKKAIALEISSNLSAYISDRDKTKLGQYYSPTCALELIYTLVHEYLTPSSVIVDLCVGRGAFFKPFSNYTFLGMDVDQAAISFNQKAGLFSAKQGDAFDLTSLKLLGISDPSQVFIVGNPPYNDTTSKNKRSLKQTKGQATGRDRDLGVAFLQHYFSLKPRIVAVLHPMSYFLKFTNFARVANRGYKLAGCHIFSSRVFATHGANAFPCVAALWVPDATSYTREQLRTVHANILTSKFPVWTLAGGKLIRSSKDFRPADYTTVDDPAHKINKYPKDEASDIDLYQYNFRDLNSLLAGGNLTNKRGTTIPVNIGNSGETLFEYCALNVIKRYWRTSSKEFDFILGNLSPIYPAALLSSPLNFLTIIDCWFASPKLFASGHTKFVEFIAGCCKLHPGVQELSQFHQILMGNPSMDSVQLRSKISTILKEQVALLR